MRRSLWIGLGLLPLGGVGGEHWLATFSVDLLTGIPKFPEKPEISR